MWGLEVSQGSRFSIPDLTPALRQNIFKDLFEKKNMEIESSPIRLHTGTRAVERTIHTLNNLKIANLEDRIYLSGSQNQALGLLMVSIHTGMKAAWIWTSPRQEKLRSEVTDIVKDNKIYLSGFTKLNVSVTPKRFNNYVSRTEEREVTEFISNVRRRRISCCSTRISLKKKPVKPISDNFEYLYSFIGKENPGKNSGSKI